MAEFIQAPPPRTTPSSVTTRFHRWLAWGGLLCLGGLAAYWLFLFSTLTLPHGGERQSLLIYGAPFFLEPGLDLERNKLKARLERLGYRRVPCDVRKAGDYCLTPTHLDVYLHGDPDRHVPGLPHRLTLEEGRVVRLSRLPGTEEVATVALEPPLIGGMQENHRQVREWIPFAVMPKPLIDAVLSVEDRRFYQHHGLDLVAVARAAWANLRRRAVVQGGSTITQQLAKNLFYSPQRTFTRKLKEASASLILEAKYGKDEILESYLNEVYFGQFGSVAVHGVGEAAKRYFGKPVQGLTVPEAALLAGMIRAPNLYSPWKDAGQARARRDLVLRRLEEAGKLSPEEGRAAATTPVPVTPIRGQLTDAPYFVDYLLPQVEAWAGGEPHPGLKVISTLDLEIQQVVEKVLQAGLARLESRHPSLKRPGSPLQGAVVVLNPKTGDVTAMAGGRDYRASQFNRAAQARRQPGSLIKPFVYVAAFESSLLSPEGTITPASLIDDAPITFPTAAGSWSPQNYDRQFRGEVTVRTALEQSLNVPTVRVAQVIGMRPITDVFRNLGLPAPQDENLSVALGTSEVSLLEITAAFGALAQGGWFAPPTGIRAMTEPGGEPLVQDQTGRRKAVSPQTAYLVTSLLEGVIERGTAARAKAMGLGKRIAGKTGTTDEHRDAWFVGYTSNLVVGVWVGFDDGKELRLTGAEAALPIWMEVVRQIVPPDTPEFARPAGIVTQSIDPQSGMLATSACPDVVEEVFIEGTEPTEYCPLHGGGILERLRRGLGFF